MTQAKRSNAEIVELIEKTKVQQHIQDRKRKLVDLNEGGEHSAESSAATKEKMVRKFRQTQAIGDQYGEKDSQVDPRFLQSVFGKTKQL